MSDAVFNELDLSAVRRAFDQAAPVYDRHAVLQHEVEQRLLERLEYVRSEPVRMLDVGCGTGIAGRTMQELYPRAQVIGLDWSTGMLERFRNRIVPGTASSVVCADMQALPIPARSMDVVFSSLAMQWSADTGQLLSELRRVLKPGGMFLFSTFGPDTLHELRSAWSQVDQRPHVNQFADVHDIGNLVVAAGFVEPVFDVDIITLEYREAIGLMRDLKAIGAHNAASDRSSGLTGKKKFARVLEAYGAFSREGKFPATYEVIYGVAFGPKDGQPFRTLAGDVVTFPVDALRTAGKKEP
jgi:malonyl-CoA O-methyltransferase